MPMQQPSNTAWPETLDQLGQSQPESVRRYGWDERAPAPGMEAGGGLEEVEDAENSDLARLTLLERMVQALQQGRQPQVSALTAHTQKSRPFKDHSRRSLTNGKRQSS